MAAVQGAPSSPTQTRGKKPLIVNGKRNQFLVLETLSDSI
jgi:hypothetical protein